MAGNPFTSPFGAAASGALAGYNAGIGRDIQVRQFQAEMAQKMALAQLLYQGKIDPANIRANTQKSLFTGDGLTDPNGNPVQGSGVTREQQVQGGIFNAGQRNANVTARLLGMGQANQADLAAAGVQPAGVPGGAMANYQTYGTITPGRVMTGYLPPSASAPPQAPPVAPAASAPPPAITGAPVTPGQTPAPAAISTGVSHVYSGPGPLVADAGRANILNKIASTNLINNGRLPNMQAKTQILNDQEPYAATEADGKATFWNYKGQEQPDLSTSVIGHNNAVSALDTAMANSIPGKTAAQIAADRAAAALAAARRQAIPTQLKISQQVADNGTTNAHTSQGRLSLDKTKLYTPGAKTTDNFAKVKYWNGVKNQVLGGLSVRDSNGNVTPRQATPYENSVITTANQQLQALNGATPMPVRIGAPTTKAPANPYLNMTPAQLRALAAHRGVKL